MGTTVEAAAGDGLDRAVGVIVVRPADYFTRTNGLAEFVLDFNRELELNRRRRSAGCRLLEAAALTPASLASPLLRGAGA